MTKTTQYVLDGNRDLQVAVLRIHDGAWGARQVEVINAKGHKACVHERRLTPA